MILILLCSYLVVGIVHALVVIFSDDDIENEDFSFVIFMFFFVTLFWPLIWVLVIYRHFKS